MKNTVKIILICVILFLIAVSPVFSLNTLDSLITITDGFIDDLARSLPFYSTIGLNWSDAYIGKSPSGLGFGFGVTAGFTTINFTSINNMLKMFNVNIPVNNVSSFQKMGLPFPGYTGEFRIGGIGIPLDFGIKYSYISPNIFDAFMDNFSNEPSFNLNHMLIGGDVRFGAIDMKVFPLKLSVSIGFNYLKGGIKATVPAENASFTFKDNSGIEYTIVPSDPEMGLEWNTFNIELKTQVSFPLKILTPYLGLGLGFALSEAGYNVSSKTSIIDSAGNTVPLSTVENTLKNLGITDVSETGFETIKKVNSINMRGFGGFSINMAFIRLDFTGMYNFLGNNFGATLGLRFQM
jgi:hypothetical protein